MSVFRLFSFNTLASCRSALCSRKALVSCDEQRASITHKAMEKLGIPIPPKRPMIPYLKFAQMLRPKIVSCEPNITPHDVIKKVAVEWQQVDPEEKKLLQKEYLTEMQTYMANYANYKKTITPEQETLLQAAKKKKKLAKEMAKIQEKKESMGRPKKPPSAFIKYMLEIKNTRDQSIKYTEWLSRVSKVWDQLSDIEKKKYQDQVEAELKVYQKELLAWEESMLREGHIDIVRNKNFLEKDHKKKSNVNTTN